jgi:hypothetical protein
METLPQFHSRREGASEPAGLDALQLARED